MIKFLVMDVDGTLTDGKIYIGNDGEIMKVFNVKDGYGIKQKLIPNNIIPIIITGRSSKSLINRCHEIGIENIYQNQSNKLTTLIHILRTYSMKDGIEYTLKDVAYIGDDLNDFEIMNEINIKNGITGCPADSAKQIKQISKYICIQNGGMGAVREFIDRLLE